jgi:hypothetical protein
MSLPKLALAALLMGAVAPDNLGHAGELESAQSEWFKPANWRWWHLLWFHKDGAPRLHYGALKHSREHQHRLPVLPPLSQPEFGYYQPCWRQIDVCPRCVTIETIPVLFDFDAPTAMPPIPSLPPAAPPMTTEPPLMEPPPPAPESPGPAPKAPVRKAPPIRAASAATTPLLRIAAVPPPIESPALSIAPQAANAVSQTPLAPRHRSQLGQPVQGAEPPRAPVITQASVAEETPSSPSTTSRGPAASSRSLWAPRKYAQQNQRAVEE